MQTCVALAVSAACVAAVCCRRAADQLRHAVQPLAVHGLLRDVPHPADAARVRVWRALRMELGAGVGKVGGSDQLFTFLVCLPQLEGLRLQVAGRLARRRVRRLCTCIDIQVGLLLRVHAGCDGVVRVAGVFVCVYLRVACGCLAAARSYLVYHSKDQVVAGGAVGIALGWLLYEFGCKVRSVAGVDAPCRRGCLGTWSTAWAQMAGGLTLPYARRRCPCAVRAAVLPCHRQLAHLSVLLHSRLYTVWQRAAGGVRQRLQAGTGPSKRVKKKMPFVPRPPACAEHAACVGRAPCLAERGFANKMQA